MIVAEIMTKAPISVQPETRLADAARTMLDHHISGLPVIDKEGFLVGIVTEGDLLRRVELGTGVGHIGWLKTFLMPDILAKDYVRTHGRLVGEVMTATPICVVPETSLAEVTELMRRHHVKRLPVVENKVLVGIISRSDLLTALTEVLMENVEGAASDEAIRGYILNELSRQRWAPKSSIRVEVKNSVVNLEGTILSDNERQAVKVIAENAPGAKKVNDNLVFIDPTAGMTLMPQ